MYQAKDVPGVKSAEAFYSNIITWKHPDSRKETSIQALGFNPEQPLLNLPEVNQRLDKIKLLDVVLFERNSRGNYRKAMVKAPVF